LPRKKCKTPAPHPKILSTTVPKLDPAASQLAHDLSTNLLPAARMTDSAKSKRGYLNASLNLHAGLRNYHQNLIADSCTNCHTNRPSLKTTTQSTKISQMFQFVVFEVSKSSKISSKSGASAAVVKTSPLD
jgi:hypothetical protein